MHLRGCISQHLKEYIRIRPVAVVAQTIDEESGSAIHSAADATAEIITNFFRVRVRGQLARDLLSIDSDLRSVHHEILALERVLILEEDVVHLPESPLGPRCLSRLGRLLSMGMCFRERKVAEDEADPVIHATAHLLNNRMRAAAVRTLEVTILYKRDGRAAGAERVIVLGHLYC